MSGASIKLNVLGDSFSTPDFLVPADQSFWGLMAQELGTGVVNFSNHGFGLDHVLHILLSEEFDFEQDFFFVGIPPLTRYMAYDDNAKVQWSARSYETMPSDQYCSREIKCLENTQRHTFEQRFVNDRTGAVRFNAEWNDVQNLEKIYLLCNYLKSNRAKFVVGNLTTPIHYQSLWPAGGPIMRKIRNSPECILFEDTYMSVNCNDGIKPADYDKYGWHGHHGSAGNKNWYDKIIKPKMIQLDWIKHA